jgi:ABC-type multidrug transport system permease subunit
MLRAAWIVFENEFRLLARDRTALFMLFFAPIVIIAVAGFSLGNLFGAGTGRRIYVIPLVDHDHGAIARAIIDGLSRESAVRITPVSDDYLARALVSQNDESPMAVVIPAGTTAAFESGQTAFIRLYVDPVKRVEASAFELRLSGLSRDIAASARDRAQTRLSEESLHLRAEMERLAKEVSTMQARAADYQRELQRMHSSFQRALEARIQDKILEERDQTRAAIDRAIMEQKVKVQGELASKQAAMTAVVDYLRKLESSRRSFEQWLARLKSLAGGFAVDIPPPPSWPSPPSEEQIAELSKPLDLSLDKTNLMAAVNLPDSEIQLPKIRIPPIPRISLDVHSLAPRPSPVLPGDIGWQDGALAAGHTQVNSFDQYVPGFGITFLLLDVLWGVSIGLIDERDWGTLQRLRVSGASVPGMMVGKFASRFLSGFVQMVVLFSIGWLLFGIELGRSPLMLLVPTVAIAFAASAFGLVIAGVAQTRDAVLPIGSVATMTMSAMGGCWWPLSFEPVWMRSVAAWMPTTWTMRAYNDLMIRWLDPSHAVWSSVLTLLLGIAFLGAGVIAAKRVYE